MLEVAGKKVKITLSVHADVARFIEIHGGARKTDLAKGKVNVSDEVETLVRANLMAKLTPEVVGWELVRQAEQGKALIEDANRQIRDLFGVSSIDEWVVREQEGQRLEADLVVAQRKIREDLREEKLRELTQLWGVYHKDGRRPTRQNELAWAKGHAQELRLVGLSPEEFLARMSRSRDHPEVG